ncbi:MAG: lysine--tRNA ligase [Candidatus Harrisonbacteria bacterium CG10_big_fil_rev_8_21_14_0_10_49_15]|uniref:Lysine--tRNA ligase n=1 Tax=Candidatus Harrisonbacteria bacterium CG10_big_fil_rev_8_21_14_0_10_49_15 TaxID=1974587 RepID=A0A2H0ULF3_9BACT|nr:MAG: lysine--tRNA ligase [Candidatus Harrisonbacteria bacterium CG10_big_fil_rev_8_21_14_0_10_49_15]
MLEDIRAERLKKKEQLETAGQNPYPATVNRTHTSAELLAQWDELEAQKTTVSVVGRVFARRGQGGVMFLDLKDESGGIQLVFKQDTGEQFELLRDTLDIGDFVEATGQAFVTQKGEKSIEASKLRIITKSLRPIPSEHYGVKDIETRLRQRYLDLLMNPELRQMFRQKSIFWQKTRDFLTNEGFLEVETPVLESTTGGAEARPFATHHNALDIEMYLRISLELPQKRLLVGGFEKTFEIGRVFRNEGMDADHLQDYTQMEFYAAYHNYNDLMRISEKLIKEVIQATVGTLKTTYQGNEIDWSGEWKTIDYCDEFKKETGIDIADCNLEQLQEKAKELGIKFEKNDGMGRLIDSIYKRTVRAKVIQPVFLIHHPVIISPLSKRVEKEPHKTERVQLLAGGSELTNGFSELNDPIDQRERFEQQAKLREEGDDEAQMMDEDFVIALEHGMPPAAGFSYSERLFAVLMDKPIRETVFFPTLRPKQGE